MSEKPKRMNDRLARVTETMTALDQACIKLAELQDEREFKFADPGFFHERYPDLDWIEHGSELRERIEAATQLVRFRLAELFTNLLLADDYRMIMEQISKHDLFKR